MKYLKFLLIIFVLFYNCKGQIESPNLNKTEHYYSNELFIGKEFYSGNELMNFEFVKGEKSSIDSISYSIYKSLYKDEKYYIFSLEKLISNDDVEFFKIIDTIHLTNISNLQLEYKKNLLSLVKNGKEIKTWKLDIGNDNISKDWLGEYSLFIDYGKLDEISEMIIQYDLIVGNDNCLFSGMGYKTYFTDSCSVEQVEGNLIIKYINQIEGDGISKHLNIDTLAILTKENDGYYIKSPFIADKNWEYNSLIKILKK